MLALQVPGRGAHGVDIVPHQLDAVVYQAVHIRGLDLWR